MKKVIIIGSSGAGKSTLAKQLAEELGIPHIELDSLYHQKDWQPRDRDEFKAEVYELAKQPGWVFCGNYFNKLGGTEFWKMADAVIWCDYAFPLILHRLITRTLRRAITKEELWNGNKEHFVANFFTADSLILWMMKTWKQRRKRYNELFADPASLPGVTLVHLKTPAATRRFVRDSART